MADQGVRRKPNSEVEDRLADLEGQQVERLVVTNSVAQSIPASTGTTLQFNTIDVSKSTTNMQAWYNTGTYRFQPQKAGVYLINAGAFVSAMDNRAYVYVLKNNSTNERSGHSGGGTGDMGMDVTVAVEFNGSSDFIEIQFFHFSGTGNKTVITSPPDTFFEVIYLGKKVA